ncbi:DUF3237 family protein [Gilvimarinus sp. F26214L]|uniref:DUF3237 family protein n=1 Tax=Gilvimarinus sp. DZF01 TaxID=3461371 RepID=UPI004045CDB8
MRKLKAFVWVWMMGVTMAAQAEDWASGVEPLTTELVMELKVAIGKPVNIGASDLGARRFIPITGGEFRGRNGKGGAMRGKVLSGGADWQLTRPDGVTEIKAIYAIETEDGQVIAVNNEGLVAPAENSRPYVRTAPRFSAPEGDYQWLNKRVFTGTITPSPKGDFVTIRVFQIN